MRLFKHDMLLFCKEHTTSKRILYFVEFDTLDDLSPRIHRYSISMFAFEEFDLGCVYYLEAIDTRIVASKLDGTYELSDSDYLLLMELREMRFGESDRGKGFRREDYYTFAETQAITQFSEPFFRRLGLNLLRLTAYALSLLIPFSLYTLLLFQSFMRQGRLTTSLSGPILAVGALPFMVFLMSLLFTLVSILFLQWPLTRYEMLKLEVLRYAGMRKSIRMTSAERKHKQIVGLIALGIFVFSFVLSLVLRI